MGEERIDIRYFEFIPRPKKDGLHESGYRYIQLVGVTHSRERIDCGGWHDHLLSEVPVNIDVEPDGTIRIMPAMGTRFWVDAIDMFWGSTAWITAGGQLI
jgi:hypothetical protein